MFLSAGNDGNNQLGIAPTSKNNIGNGFFVVYRVPFDLDGVQCVSGGRDHSVIIKLGSVFAAGDDRYFFIGSDSRQVYETFTEIKISEEPISWAACSGYFTLYLTASGKAILGHPAKWERIHVEVGKKAVSVFAGEDYGGIIDAEGAIHILDKFNIFSNFDPHKPPRRFSFESPAVDLACCVSFVCALTSDGRVFANGKLNKGKEDFAEVSSLKGKKIKKLSGYCDTCAALTSDGRVFICGKNDYGQFGNGTTISDYSSFTEVRIEEAIKDVSCSLHTLFLTESNRILGCGNNDYCQLFKKTEGIVLSPIEITRFEASQVITGNSHSFILSGTGKLENPAKAHFGFPRSDFAILLDKIEEHRNESQEQRVKIDSLVSLCQNQSRVIDQLVNICQEQSQRINHLNEIHQKLREEHQNKFDDIDNKLDIIVKYINDLDIY